MAQDGSITRREFLARTGAGIVGGAALASGVGANVAPRVPTVTLGKTGRRVSRIACGGSWDVEPSVLAAAFATGVNYLDTAETYEQGQSERVMGEFLKQHGGRKDVFLVTKSHRYHQLEQRLEGSLRRLQVDYVDALYLHGIEDPAIISDPEVISAAERLKKAGKIRFFGFSCHASTVVQCLEAAAKAPHLDLIMFKYSFRDRDSDAMNRAIDKCAKANLGLVAMKTLDGGTNMPAKFDVFRRTGMTKAQAALRAVWADERIHVINSEMTTHEQVAENSAAAIAPLTRAEDELLRRYAALTSHLRCRGCDHLCRAAAGTTLAVADVLRFQMYHDGYGKRRRARELFAALPPEEQDFQGDWERGEAACPHDLPLRQMLARAQADLA